MSDISSPSSGLPATSASNLEDSVASEFESRLRQVDDLLNAAAKRFEASDDRSFTTSESGRLKDIDAYLASKGIQPTPRVRKSPEGVLSRAQPLDVSSLPPDRQVVTSNPVERVPVHFPAAASVPIVHGAVPPGPVPDVRRHDFDDSLGSVLPLKFSHFLEESNLQHGVPTNTQATKDTFASQQPGTVAVSTTTSTDSTTHVFSVNAPLWRDVSSRLRELGAPPLVVTSTSASVDQGTVDESSVIAGFHFVFSLIAAQARSLQDALSSASHTDRSSSVDMSATVARLQKQLTSLQAAAQDEKQRNARAVQAADEKVRVLQQHLTDAKQRLAHSEHRGKRREAEVEELRAKLSQSLSPHRDADGRLRKITSPGRESTTSSFMSPDRKSADAVVASFEKQREDMASEIGFLRSECDRLHDLLRRAENTISDLKSQAGGHLDVSSHSHVSDARKQESFRAAQHRLEEKQQRLYDREQRLKSEIARWEAAVSSSQAAAKELQIELDAARLELDSRPTMKQYKDLRQRLAVYESSSPPGAEMDGASRRRSHSGTRPGPLSDRKHFGTAHLVATDKAFHNRLSRGLSEMGSSATIEIIKELCLELGLKHPDSLPAAVRKLKRAVEAMPAMEAFIQRVNDVVTATSYERHCAPTSLDVVPSVNALERCLAELQSWSRDIRERDGNKRFRAAVQLEIRKRIALGGSGFSTGVSLASEDLSDEDLLVCLRRILRNEATNAKIKEVYAEAEAELVSSGPSGIVPGIVAHFGKLFDVKHLDGMFPRMNELFLFVNEMRNFTAVLKDLLDLGGHVSTNTLLVAVREAIGLRPRSQNPRRPRRGSSTDEDSVVSLEQKIRPSRVTDHVVLSTSRRHGDPPVVEYEATYRARDPGHLAVGIAKDSARVLDEPVHGDLVSGMNAAEVGDGVESAAWVTDD